MLKTSIFKFITVFCYLSLSLTPQVRGDLHSTTLKCHSILSFLSGKEKPILYRIRLDTSPSEILKESLPMVESRGVVENLKSIVRNKRVASVLLKALKSQTVENRNLDKGSLTELLKENVKYTFILTGEGLEFIKVNNSPAGFF